MDKNKLKVQYLEIKKLKTADYNPRKWSESAINNLKKSIKRFGLVDPLIVNSAPNRENIIVGGHFRLQVIKDLGYKKAPVIYVCIPEIEKEKELNLRLNRNLGEWDFELLKKFDFDLLLNVGFDDQDLSSIWDSILEIEDDHFDTQEELGKIKTPKIKLGEVFRLGKHTLVCGDATEFETIKKLTSKKEVNMIYCDPPYNISLDYHKGVGTKGKYGGKTKDNRGQQEYEEFLKKSIANALLIAKNNTHVFYWCDEKNIGLIQKLYKESGIKNQRVCLWIKNSQNPTPQVAFNKVYEPCVYGIRGDPYLAAFPKNLNEILNKEVSTGNRTIDDILDLLNIWLVKRLSGQNYEHPTEKPPTLHEKPLRRCSKPGDVVLDLFGGSGSTLIACEQLKRNCLIVEIEPIFCDLIIKRFEKLTNEKAKKIN